MLRSYIRGDSIFFFHIKKETKKEKIMRELVIKYFKLFLYPHFLFCFFLSWMMTNGWSYVLLFLGTLWGIHNE